MLGGAENALAAAAWASCCDACCLKAMWCRINVHHKPNQCARGGKMRGKWVWGIASCAPTTMLRKRVHGKVDRRITQKRANFFSGN